MFELLKCATIYHACHALIGLTKSEEKKKKRKAHIVQWKLMKEAFGDLHWNLLHVYPACNVRFLWRYTWNGDRVDLLRWTPRPYNVLAPIDLLCNRCKYRTKQKKQQQHPRIPRTKSHERWLLYLFFSSLHFSSCLFVCECVFGKTQ